MGVKDTISSVDITCLRITIVTCVAVCLLFEIVSAALGASFYFFVGGTLEITSLICAIINLLVGMGKIQWGNKKIQCIVGTVCMGIVAVWSFVALIWWNVHVKKVCDYDPNWSCGFVWGPLIIMLLAIVSTMGFIIDGFFRNDA